MQDTQPQSGRSDALQETSDNTSGLIIGDLPDRSGRAFGDRPQLSEEIAAYIRELVMSGRLRGGQPINIEALARELRTSPTPIREALHVLRGEGFIQVEPRRGYRIAPLSRRDVEDMFLIQGMISGELAARAAEAADEQFIDEIVGIQSELQQAEARSDDNHIQQLNYEFHRLINLRDSSPKLTWLLSLLVRYVPRVLYSTIDGWHTESLHGHEAVIDALRRKDPDAARLAMRAHFAHAGEQLASHLERHGFWEGT